MSLTVIIPQKTFSHGEKTGTFTVLLKLLTSIMLFSSSKETRVSHCCWPTVMKVTQFFFKENIHLVVSRHTVYKLYDFAQGLQLLRILFFSNMLKLKYSWHKHPLYQKIKVIYGCRLHCTSSSYWVGKAHLPLSQVLSRNFIIWNLPKAPSTLSVFLPKDRKG